MPNLERTNREARKLLLQTQEREDRKASKAGKGGAPRSARGKGGTKPTFQDAVIGVILGTLIAVASSQLGIQSIPLLRGEHIIAGGAVVGLFLGISRLRPLLWILGGLVTAGLLVIGYTPLAGPLIRSVTRSDRLRPVEAVVVLSSDVFPDGGLPPSAQIRLLRGYEVVREGYAKRLVLTRLRPPQKSYREAISHQLKSLAIDFPIDETSEVGNTRDEAVAVAALAQKRGWKQVILVSDASHLRRAGAAFEKAGVKVLCSPCPDREYDLQSLSDPWERLHAFRDWMWEAIGYETYKFRGWI